MPNQGKWRIKGKDTFENEFYSIAGEYDTEELALAAAKTQWDEIQKSQPIEDAGDPEFDGIQGRVWIVRPDGNKYNFHPTSKAAPQN